MKKKLFYVALAITALASCSSNDFVGDESPQGSIGTNGAIGFNLNVPTPTRGTSGDATKLNNLFIVWGEKNETSNAAPSTGNLVFPNYKVTYGTNTAYTTTSNTKDWEYVGLKWSAADAAKVKIANTAVTVNDQTIKYWDYAASNYVFTAVSAKPEDITAGRVVINKLTAGTSTVYEKGYTVTLSKTAATGTDPDIYPSLADLYFSDRNVIAQGTGSDRTATNAYGGNVTFNFRNSLSHVRAGVYETIPGYAVTAIKFYVTGDVEAKVSSTSAFGVIAPNIGTNYEGTLTVTYYDNTNTATENHPKLSFSGTPAKDLILGTNMSTLSTSNTLGTTSASPTWDTNGGTFTSVLPQIDNTTNMKLKVDYTLYNSVTGETIDIKGKTAEVPAQYLQWKSNYKYTYLFKITDDNLYPITFDACYIEDENGNQETITTVSEPSITTFGAIYNGTNYTKYVTNGNEYNATGIATGSWLDIFATFTEGSTVKTPTVGSSGAQHVNVFKVTSANPTNFPITEASVAEAIANPAMSVDIYTRTGDAGTQESPYTYTKVTDATTIEAGTTYYKADNSNKAPTTEGYTETTAIAGTDYKVGAKLNVTNVTTDASANFTAAPAAVTTVPAEDGTTKTIDALKLTGVKTGTYAIEYEASSAWTGSYNKVYKVIVVQ